MNAPHAVTDWTTANQRLLVAEFARIACLLRGDDPVGAQADIDALREAMPEPAAIDRIAARFGLSSFERDVLLLAAGFEMDAELGALCAGSAADARRARATFALALAALPAPHWSALTPARPLRRWRLVEVADAAMLVAAPLRIDERVLHCLAGVDDLDVRLQPILRTAPAAHPIARAHERIAEDIVATLAREESPLPAIQLLGNDRHGKRDVAAAAARRCGLRLFVLASDDLPAAASDLARARGAVGARGGAARGRVAASRRTTRPLTPRAVSSTRSAASRSSPRASRSRSSGRCAASASTSPAPTSNCGCGASPAAQTRRRSPRRSKRSPPNSA